MFHFNSGNILVMILSQFMDDKFQDNHDLPILCFV